MKNILKKILLFSLFITNVSISVSQNSDTDKSFNTAVYNEVLGNAGYGSTNIELLLSGTNIQCALRAGIGVGFYNTISIPAEISFLIGRKGQFFETGTGITYNFGDDPMLILRVGYRFNIFNDENIYCRVGFTPYMELWNDENPFEFKPYGGLGIGYIF
ncbi:MAG: hypothetical protein K8S16_10985 [Bacteroidales bacterium]|nr:hypothetical protein [Bacteroidales bacterium]